MTMAIGNQVKCRMTPREYLSLCVETYRRHWKGLTLPIVAMLVLQFFVRLDVNYTESLPDHVFLTIKGWKSNIKHGDYVAFEFPTENPASPFRKGAHMVKLIAGVPGDEVRVSDDGQVRIISASDPGSARLGGISVGIAKPQSKKGWKLEAVKGGVIPEGHYYVYAPHTDSLDSRYAMVGMVPMERIMGKTLSLF